MTLSLLVPSKRPTGLAIFRDSLRRHAVTDDVELVVVVDDQIAHLEVHHRETVIHLPPEVPLSIAHLLHVAYACATGAWVMFANDDLVCETPGWDRRVFDAIMKHGDLTVLWPEDHLFGARLACFPIVSRRLLDLIGFFPQPYRRYKVDDTLFAVVPPDHRQFLPDVHFRHLNDRGVDGYRLPDGRIYPIDREAAAFDTVQWAHQADARRRMHTTIVHAINQGVVCYG